MLHHGAAPVCCRDTPVQGDTIKATGHALEEHPASQEQPQQHPGLIMRHFPPTPPLSAPCSASMGGFPELPVASLRGLLLARPLVPAGRRPLLQDPGEGCSHKEGVSHREGVSRSLGELGALLLLEGAGRCDL